MGAASIFHWLIILIFLGTIVLSVWMQVRILHKAGFSGWWMLLTLIPLVNLIMLWVFAFAEWPALAPAPQINNSGSRRP